MSDAEMMALYKVVEGTGKHSRIRAHSDSRDISPQKPLQQGLDAKTIMVMLRKPKFPFFLVKRDGKLRPSVSFPANTGLALKPTPDSTNFKVNITFVLNTGTSPALMVEDRMANMSITSRTRAQITMGPYLLAAIKAAWPDMETRVVPVADLVYQCSDGSKGVRVLLHAVC